MTILSFYTEFTHHDDNRDHEIEQRDYSAREFSFFVWLSNRFISLFTFNRQGGLYSLLWQWMYYFNRNTAKFILAFLIVSIVIIASVQLYIMLLVAFSSVVMYLLAIVPITSSLSLMLATFYGLLYAALIVYSFVATGLLVAEVYALISYFLEKKQWRKTATVSHFILSAVLENGVDVDRINTVASAINVIRGKEKKHCVYEILDTLRRSNFTQTHDGAKKFAALIRAFAQLGMFDQYAVLNSGAENFEQAEVINFGEANPACQKITIRQQDDNYRLGLKVVRSADRTRFYTRPYHIYNFEQLIHSILSITENAPPHTLELYQCNALTNFIRRLNGNEAITQHQVLGSVAILIEQFYNAHAEHPEQNNLPIDQNDAASREQKIDTLIVDQKQAQACEKIQLQDPQHAAKALAIFFKYHVIENPDAENPDAENPDAENPDAENPDAEKPDAENPDAENPDAEKSSVENINEEKPNSNQSSLIPRKIIDDEKLHRFLCRLSNNFIASITSDYSRQARKDYAIVFLNAMASNQSITNNAKRQESKNTALLLHMAQQASSSDIETLQESVFGNKPGHHLQFKYWFRRLKTANSSTSSPLVYQSLDALANEHNMHKVCDEKDLKEEKPHRRSMKI